VYCFLLPCLALEQACCFILFWLLQCPTRCRDYCTSTLRRF
jgi:hypothetical protein